MQGCPVSRLNHNRCLFLPGVQCAACKQVGHIAKHCSMLATAICLKRYMKHNLLAVHATIEQGWPAKLKERLGNPHVTPRQVMQAYVEDLDIMVARLNDKMDWAILDDDDSTVFPDDSSE
jgi:hypothetical protein